jgi:type 1 glutamine amidotransferase
VFYTSFGHDHKVWRDARFQKHLFGGLDWAVGRKPGDAAPSGKKPAGG